MAERLGREDVFDFAGADPERERAESAVRGGVAVAANDRHARARVALFRPDDVNNALLDIADVVKTNAKLFAVGAERFDLLARNRVFDRFRAVGRRDVVVLDGHHLFRTTHFATGHPEAFERLRTRNFVAELLIDVKNRVAVRFLVNQVFFPNFIVHRFRRGGLRRFLRHVYLDDKEPIFSKRPRLGGAKTPRRNKTLSLYPRRSKRQAGARGTGRRRLIVKIDSFRRSGKLFF